LISCSAAGPTLPPAPPTVVEVPVYRYRPLPSDCLQTFEVAELGEGATNEDLARAYRDALDLARSRAAVVDECRRFANGPPGPDAPP
jgi:hypothetical protein